MTTTEAVQVPYWFWQGFGLVVFALVGQVFVKWIDQKFFTKEDKWTGEERRQTVEIDELFIKQFLEIYKKHVEYVGELSTHLQASTTLMKEFIKEFREHDEMEEESQQLIRHIHARGKPA